VAKMRKMKDSGIEWIGEIPEGWEVKKFKFLFSFNKGLTITKEDLRDKGIPCVNYGEIHSKYGFEVNPEKNELKCVDKEYLANSSDSLLKYGDFVFADTSEDLEGSGNFTYLNSHTDTFAGYHTIIAKAKTKLNTRFIAYYFDSVGFRSQIRYKVFGIKVFSISQNILKEAQIIFPSSIEQEKIINFLDPKCSAIDKSIELLNSSIKKLQEYRKSIITEAVTKGLNPNVPMKDSGIEWIGEIPEGWDIWRLKYLFRIKKNIAGEEGYDILSITQKGIKIKDISTNEGQIAESYENYQIVNIGDFAMNHMDLLTGWVDISKYEGVTSPDYRVFRSINQFNSNNYYLYLFQMCYFNKIFYGIGQGVSFLGRWRLQADKFLNMYLPIPSITEQKEIAIYIEQKCSVIEKTITEKQTLIERLVEYKKSLTRVQS
jgi:type I restriction enzyme S subunit